MFRRSSILILSFLKHVPKRSHVKHEKKLSLNAHSRYQFIKHPSQIRASGLSYNQDHAVGYDGLLDSALMHLRVTERLAKVMWMHKSESGTLNDCALFFLFPLLP